MKCTSGATSARDLVGDATAFEMLLSSTNPVLVKIEMDCGWVSAAGYHPAMFLE